MTTIGAREYLSLQDRARSLGAMRYLQAFVLALIVCAFLFLYRNLAVSFTQGEFLVTAIRDTLSSPVSIVAWVLLFVALLLVALAYFCYRKRVNAFVFKWRYALAGVYLLVTIVFELSGSSLGMWATTLDGELGQGLLLGTPRWMRTDEWATSLAMVFAQFNDESGFLPYFGEVFRGASTDMYWLNAPVFDYASLFRPFMWGYFVLGLAKGLAFWWNARFIVLLMLSFEFALRFFGKSRRLALAYALLVSLAPAVTWWGMSDHMIYIQALFLVAVAFLKASSWPKRFGFATLFFYVFGCYVLVVYPAWQVPFGLLIAVCGIVYAVQNRKSFCWKPAQLVLCCLPGIVFLAVSFMYIVATSAETVQVVTNTVYPGKRLEFGGADPAYLLRYPMSLFVPLTTGGLSTDRVDMLSSFFDLAPLGLLWALYLIFAKKQRDGLLISLVVLDLFFIAYYVLGFPEIVAKLTLMSYTTSERMVVVIGYTNLLLLFKACSLASPKDGWHAKGVVAVIFGLVLCAVSYFIEPAYMGWAKLAVEFALLAFTAFFFLAKKEDWIVIAALAIALFGGAMVNPVQQGIAPVQDDGLIEKIRELKASSNKRWLSETDWAENIPVLGGAPTISSTHTYPDMELWSVLDPDGSDDLFYNRYAHLRVLVDDADESEIGLIEQDVVSATIPLDLLDDLDVGYIVSNRDLTEFNDDDNVDFNLVYDGHQYDIYEVVYGR